jgi:hypothetical protein
MFGDPALATVQPVATELAPHTLLAAKGGSSSTPCPVKAIEESAAEKPDVNVALSQTPLKKHRRMSDVFYPERKAAPLALPPRACPLHLLLS